VPLIVEQVESVAVATTLMPESENKHDEPDPWGMVADDGVGDGMPPLEPDDSKVAEPVPDVPRPDVSQVPVSAPVIVQDRAPLHPLLYRMPQASPRGLAAFMMAAAPPEAAPLEEVDAWSPAEGQDMIDDLAARNNCSFSIPANTARIALISTADAKIAKLNGEIANIEKDVRNARALVPLTLLTNRIRQTAFSKRSKQQLAMQATSCRLQEAKRARLQ